METEVTKSMKQESRHFSDKRFKEWWKNEAIKNTPSYCAVPKYEVVKRGYTKVKPDDRRVIFRLPYFPVDMDNRPAEFVARVWVNEVDKRWYDNESDMYEHLVCVIKQWRKWKEMDTKWIIK